LIRQQKEVDEENLKCRVKVEAAESMMADLKREQEEERRTMNEDRRLLQEQIVSLIFIFQ
jgi:hypothetical protein